jgi:regulator of protease activity HflC (stomatin/prohibitin superfamily)
MTLVVIVLVLVLLGLLLTQALKILPEFEQGVVFRLGRVVKRAKGPGLFFIWPLIDKMEKVSLQEVTDDVPPQDVITRDNVTVHVDAIVYFRVIDPVKAIVEVDDYKFATSQVCVTALRSVCGTVQLDQLLAEQDRLNSQIQTRVDKATDGWGIKVTRVEITDVVLPSDFQRAMAREAEAERDRRARVINADGEFQAARRLADAAEVMAEYPIAYQLRTLQTVTDVASQNNSTLVLPIPIELLGPFQAAFNAVRSPDARLGKRDAEKEVVERPTQPLQAPTPKGTLGGSI